ncbi:MAG: hypothetical protein MI861_08590, partial [Pirellulales bacterium]|nr:hypothetical protein [Pirellulales bacterium]
LGLRLARLQLGHLRPKLKSAAARRLDPSDTQSHWRGDRAKVFDRLEKIHGHMFTKNCLFRRFLGNSGKFLALSLDAEYDCWIMNLRILLATVLFGFVGSVANAGLITAESSSVDEASISAQAFENLLFSEEELRRAEYDQNPSGLGETSAASSPLLIVSLAGLAVFDSRMPNLQLVDNLLLFDQHLPANPDLDGLLKPPQSACSFLTI